MAAETLSLINMKGGVGKSTLAVNLAYKYAANPTWSKNVLLVDLDPQFNASQYALGFETYKEKIVAEDTPTVWNVFEQRTRTPGGGTPKDLDPTEALVNIERFKAGNRLDVLASRLELSWALKQPAGKERLLAKFLAKVKKEYDLIVIDCAPTESVLTTAAYLASDYILVPVKPEYLSTIGLPLLARSLEEFHADDDDHEVKVAGVVFNHATEYEPEEAKSKREVRAEAKVHGWYVFDAEISYSRSYPKGAREGRPIFWTSNAHTTQKAKLHAFALELASRIGL
jgi:chromosome partitioning protein